MKRFALLSAAELGRLSGPAPPPGAARSTTQMRAGSRSRASNSVAAMKLVSAGPAAQSGPSDASTRYPATKSSSEETRRPIP
jgi:hypothetical protein